MNNPQFSVIELIYLGIGIQKGYFYTDNKPRNYPEIV